MVVKMAAPQVRVVLIFMHASLRQLPHHLQLKLPHHLQLKLPHHLQLKLPHHLLQRHWKMQDRIVGGNVVKNLVNVLGVGPESAVEKIGMMVKMAAPQVRVVLIFMHASLRQRHWKMQDRIVGGNVVKKSGKCSWCGSGKCCRKNWKCGKKSGKCSWCGS